MKAIAVHPKGLVLVHVGADVCLAVNRNTRQWVNVPAPDQLADTPPWRRVGREESDKLWLEVVRVIEGQGNRVVSMNLLPVQMVRFGPDRYAAERAAVKAKVSLGDKEEHPFTWCMEHVIPAMEKEGRAPDDPKAFCAYWKAEQEASWAAEDRVDLEADLTYRSKQQLVETALRQFMGMPPTNPGMIDLWVQDMNDVCVYYSTGGRTYKRDYVMDDMKRVTFDQDVLEVTTAWKPLTLHGIALSPDEAQRLKASETLINLGPRIGKDGKERWAAKDGSSSSKSSSSGSDSTDEYVRKYAPWTRKARTFGEAETIDPNDGALMATIDKLPVVKAKDFDEGGHDTLIGVYKKEPPQFHVLEHGGAKYVVNTEGFNYPRYIAKVPSKAEIKAAEKNYKSESEFNPKDWMEVNGKMVPRSKELLKKIRQ